MKENTVLNFKQDERLNAQLDEDEIEERHGLLPSPERAGMLSALNSDRYDNPGYLNRTEPYPNGLTLDLAELHATPDRISMSAENSFDGHLELACADMFGVENVDEAMGLISTLYHLSIRSKPFAMTTQLAEIVVAPIIRDWRANAEDAGSTDLIALVRDTLAGRWEIPDEMLLPAVAGVLQAVMLEPVG
jgi:hypothetical protein